MYQLSDSDSIDSDEGIRYKTESIRNKKSNDSRAEKRSRDSHSRRNRERSRSRSRSRHRTERIKSKKVKRDNSPQHKSSRKTSRSKVREKEVSDDRKLGKEKSRSKDETKNVEKDGDRVKKCNEHIPVGLSSPTKEITDYSKKPNSEESTEDVKQDLLFGPVLPPKTNTATEPESADEEHSENGNTFGPQLPPHLTKEPEERTPPHLTKKPDEDTVIGPVLPSHFITVSCLDDDSSDDKKVDHSTVIGPALPPHLLNKNEDDVIGPSLPPHLKEPNSIGSSDEPKEEEEDIHGPVPAGSHYSQAHVELEERALQMKMDRLDPAGDKQPVREEWMLSLPAAKAANFGLGPRQFRSKAGPDLSDRSSWTDTPEEKAKKKEGKVAPPVDPKKEAELKQIKKRNSEQEKIAKKHKRETESLLEIHRKKLKVEKKNESGPSERRPFSREVDLQVNRFDDAQKKAVLKKAQMLDSRFSTGESKFL